MIINFKSTPTFERIRKRLSKKYNSFETDLDGFIENIENLPYSDLGSNFRKYRLAIKSKGKGKSGGVRIITLDVIVSESEKDITLVYVFDKGDIDNISITKIKEFIKS